MALVPIIFILAIVFAVVLVGVAISSKLVNPIKINTEILMSPNTGKYFLVVGETEIEIEKEQVKDARKQGFKVIER